MYDTLIFAYRLALGALVLWITLQGPEPMRRTIWTILAVYLIEIWIVAPLCWPSREFAAIMAAIDVAGCVIITCPWAGKWQAVVGLAFILQFTTHVGYFGADLFYGRTDNNLYWWGLCLSGFMQLVLAGGWIAADRLRPLLSRRSRRHVVAAKARPASAE